MNPKTKTFLTWTTVWLIACTVGVSLRLYPLKNYVSHQAREKATLLVLNNLRQSLNQNAAAQYAQLSVDEQQRLAKTQFDALLRNERKNVHATIHRVAREIDEKNRPPQVFPYLLASDSFNYFNLTENILHDGSISDSLKGSKYLNRLMMAPDGHWEPLTLHPYVGLLVHKIMNLFRPAALMYTVSFTPVALMVLTLIAYLFVCRTLHCGAFASLLGAIGFVAAPIYLKRSTFGWYDNDPYNTLFPLLILGILFYGFLQRHNRSQVVGLGLLAALCVSLYTLFWHGWMLIVGVIVCSAVLYLPASRWVQKEKEATLNLLIFFAVIVGGILAGVSLLYGFSQFFILFQEGWVALTNFLEPQLSSWPDLYIAVGELRSVPLALVIEQTGGYLMVSVALAGLILSAIRTLKAGDRAFALTVLTVFTVVSFILSTGAQRFTLLCLVPLSLLFTLGVQELLDWLRNRLKRLPLPEKLRPLFVNGLLICVGCAVAVPTAVGAYQKVPTLLNPIYNDTWDRTLKKIADATPPETIVNTWWPPGHFIKAVAHRRVTFDGATINKPQAYWLANVYLSENEPRALGILRMLNNSGNQATEYLLGLGFELSDAVKVLKEITPLNAAAARVLLHGIIHPQQIDQLLALTHAQAPPSYLLIYNELVDKSIQFSFVGNWNFARIEEIRKTPSLQAAVPKPGTQEYVDYLWTLVGGTPKFSEALNVVSRSDGKLLFDQNVLIDVKEKSCAINSKKFGKGIPLSLLYVEDNHVKEKRFINANLPYSVILSTRNGTEQALLADRRLARSLFVHLYYFEGKGLQHFEPFLKEADLTKRTQIYVYKINWNK